MLMHRLSRGDTLVEVLIATAVFSFVAVGSLILMNQGTASAQRSLEITLVRQEINAQADVLRYINASYIAAYQSGVVDYGIGRPAQQWKNIINTHLITAGGDVSDFEITTCPATPPARAFIMNTQDATVGTAISLVPAITYSQVDYSTSPISAQGIWIEAVRSVGTVGSGYVDFHIRACWDSPGQTDSVSIGTIVRLYEPI